MTTRYTFSDQNDYYPKLVMRLKYLKQTNNNKSSRNLTFQFCCKNHILVFNCSISLQATKNEKKKRKYRNNTNNTHSNNDSPCSYGNSIQNQQKSEELDRVWLYPL